MSEQYLGESEAEPNQPADDKARVREAIRDTKEKIKTKSKEFATEAKEAGEEYVRQGKERAADRLGGVSERVRQTAESFQRENDPNIAHYTRLLADKLEHAAIYVRENDLDQLRGDAENLARRHPSIFFGGLFVAGLAAARFLKASSARHDPSSNSERRQREGKDDFPDPTPTNQDAAQSHQDYP